MSQRTIRFPDELEARIEARAKEESRSFAGFVKRTLEKALGSNDPTHDRAASDIGASGKAAPYASRPAPPRAPKKTSGQRTPPRPTRPPSPAPALSPESVSGPTTSPERGEGSLIADTLKQNLIAGDGYMKVTHEPVETEPGCPDCGGEYAAHPEFGRFCTGCGARVK